MTEIIDFDVSGPTTGFELPRILQVGLGTAGTGGGAELSPIRMTAHCCVINEVRITAPLRSIAIVLVAIVITIEVEHLEQIPDGRAAAEHQLSKSDFENATHQR
jgi:hypothetical protein